LIEAFAAPIVNKKETSRLIKEFATSREYGACKDKGNPHPLEIIICLASDAPDIDCSKDMHISDLSPSGRINCGGLGDLFLVKTPACPPLTRSKSYYEDKQVTVALKGQLFTSSMKAKMQDYMAAVAAARAGQERGFHPLNHAVMVCIDLVARGQRGGAYTHDKYPSCQFVFAEESGQPYICTGNNLPVQEVFYGTASIDVAFGTKYKIDAQKYQTHPPRIPWISHDQTEQD
uniref:Uncharacterized protein n=1 Tax=Oncorhynchus tshawytscha TaxID=74940 RepID=A0A8C8I9S6_ONCTS